MEGAYSFVFGEDALVVPVDGEAFGADGAAFGAEILAPPRAAKAVSVIGTAAEKAKTAKTNAMVIFFKFIILPPDRT